MASKLRAVWARLVGRRDGDRPDASAAVASDYKGYRIRPTPYPVKGQYQTAGIIEKDCAEGVKEHRFIRADMHPTEDGAAAFAITKGKQIIDELGDRLFDEK